MRGRRTRQRLTAGMPGVGRLGRREAAVLIGLAPVDRDGGRMRGYRAVAGGRAAVRKVLFMGTLAASRRNPAIRSHFQQLTARGRPKKTAPVAAYAVRELFERIAIGLPEQPREAREDWVDVPVVGPPAAQHAGLPRLRG